VTSSWFFIRQLFISVFTKTVKLKTYKITKNAKLAECSKHWNISLVHNGYQVTGRGKAAGVWR